MISQALFVFIILLMGFILCSFLGGDNCKTIEGYINHYGNQIVPETGVNGESTEVIVLTPETDEQPTSSTRDSINDNPVIQTLYYGPRGSIANVKKIGNSYKITLTNQNGNTSHYIYTPPTNANLRNEYNIIKNARFNGPYGNSAQVIKINNKYFIKITYPNGKIEIYTQDLSNVEYYNHINDNDHNNANNNDDDDDNIDSDAEEQHDLSIIHSNRYSSYNQQQDINPVYQPTIAPQIDRYSSYNQQQDINPVYQSTIAPQIDTTYYNSLPQGIPRSMIPNGDEDLYILKSQVVPPVCPACPSISACPKIESNAESCPACPPCGRCPEPSFECKKVPNYSSINNDYLPMPVLSDFTTFGM